MRIQDRRVHGLAVLPQDCLEIGKAKHLLFEVPSIVEALDVHEKERERNENVL